MDKIKVLRRSLLAFAFLFFVLAFFADCEVKWIKKLCSFMALFSMWISIIELYDTAIDAIRPSGRSKKLDIVVKAIEQQNDDTKEYAKSICRELVNLDETKQRKYSNQIEKLKNRLDKDIKAIRKEQRDDDGKEYPTYDMERRRKNLAKAALWILAFGALFSAFVTIVYDIHPEGTTFVSFGFVCLSFCVKLLGTKELAWLMHVNQTRNARKCKKDCTKAVRFIKYIG